MSNGIQSRSEPRERPYTNDAVLITTCISPASDFVPSVFIQ